MCLKLLYLEKVLIDSVAASIYRLTYKGNKRFPCRSKKKVKGKVPGRKNNS